ncbi:MAG: GGDEF domain-containing protein [Candidatus Accumulibacter sp.]|nr:GGDEF domain-containing protein [Accumulibacter sp.]
MLKATSKHLEEWANPRTVILLTTVLVGVLWIVVIASAISARRQSIETTGDALRRMTHAVEIQTRQQLQLVETLLASCSHWLMENPTRDPRHDPGFRRLLDSFSVTTRGTIQFRLLTDDGAVFDVFEQRSSLARSEAERQFLVEVGQADGLTIGTPHSFQDAGLPGWPLALPVKPGPPHLLGVLAVVDLSALNTGYERQRIQSQGRIMLLKREGTLLLHAPQENNLSGKRLGIEALLADPAGKTVSSVVLMDQPLIDNGAENMAGELATYALLADYPLMIVVSQDTNEALAPWLRQTLWIVLLAIGVTVPMAVVAYRSLRLIHALATQRAHLQQLANRDPLTGASSRPYFVERLAEKIDEVGGGLSLSVLLFDIDFFKRLNDGYGHAVGDQVLIEFAKAAESCLRDQDLLGRLGAGEFAILLPHTPIAKAVIAAERIRKKTSEIAIESAEGIVSFTTSVGVVQANADDTTTDGLLKRAGYALQQAKSKGYDRVEVASANSQPAGTAATGAAATAGSSLLF